MSDDFDKRASIRGSVVNRLHDVAEQLAQQGNGLRAGQMRRWAERIEDPKLLKTVGEGIKGTGDVVGRAIEPGDSDLGRWITEKATTPLGIAALMGAVAYPLGAYDSFQGNKVLGPLSEAQMRGEVPMTDPFQSFVQRRKHGAVERPIGPKTDTIENPQEGSVDPLTHFDQEKQANVLRTMSGALGNVASEGLGGLQKLIRGAVSNNKMQDVNPLRAGGLALGALGIGSALDVLGGDRGAGGTMQYQLQKAMFPVHERVRAEDEAVKSFASQAGKNTADMINDLLMSAVGGATDAVHNAGLSFSQEAKFQQAIDRDPVLSQADQQDLDMLRRAFKSMVRFAPQVATDEFAVSNFLREAMMAANGPDYATLGNLARVNRSLTGETR